MGRNVLAVASLVASVVLSSLVSTSEARITCDPNCASGCRRQGAGKCDLACTARYRLYLPNHTCIPRCGGYCVNCVAYMQCAWCRVGYYVVTQPNGDNICVDTPPAPATTMSSSTASTTTAPTTVAETTAAPAPATTMSSSTASTTTAPTTVAETTAAATTVETTTMGPCHPNCTSSCTASGAGYCDTQCDDHFFLNTTSHYCYECDINCQPVAYGGCDIPGTCNTSCVPYYVVFRPTLSCLACSTGCSTCTSSGPGQCDSAADCTGNTVYSNITQGCLDCDPQCQSGCDNPGYCDKVIPAVCNIGYGNTTTNKCGACDANCNLTSSNSGGSVSGCQHSGAGRCDGQCNEGYIKSSTTNTCTACQTPNADYCAACDVAGTCKTCSSSGNYTLTAGTCA